MRASFRNWLTQLLQDEGFKSNDSRDPGKRTVYGISEVYHPEMYKDGKEPTLADLPDFYLLNYWIPGGCDSLPFPLDVNHADACVNPGIGAAAKFLEQSGEHKDVLWRTTEYVFLREEYYLERVRKDPKMIYALRGWMLRCIKYWKVTVGNMIDMRELGG
jgi:hypothetical protein